MIATETNSSSLCRILSRMEVSIPDILANSSFPVCLIAAFRASLIRGVACASRSDCSRIRALLRRRLQFNDPSSGQIVHDFSWKDSFESSIDSGGLSSLAEFEDSAEHHKSIYHFVEPLVQSQSCCLPQVI